MRGREVTTPRATSEYVGILDSFALLLKVEGLRPHTISCYVREARRLGEHTNWLPLAKLGTEHVRSYLAWLSGRVAPKTVAEAQFGLRRFFRFLLAEGEIDADPTADIKLVRYRVTPQPTYSPDGVSLLIKACDSTATTGSDIGQSSPYFSIPACGSASWSPWACLTGGSRTVQVDGKTGVRVVPLGDTSVLAVQRYVRKCGLAATHCGEASEDGSQNRACSR